MGSLFQLWKRLRRRLKWRIEDRLWRLRLKMAYHLVGDRSFAANVDVVGTLYFRRFTFNTPLMRDVWVFETEAMRKKERNND